MNKTDNYPVERSLNSVCNNVPTEIEVAELCQIGGSVARRLAFQRDTLLAQLNELKAAALWHPIESAPKNGTPVLLYDGHYHVAKWSEDKYEPGWLVAVYPDGALNQRLMVTEPVLWQRIK